MRILFLAGLFFTLYSCNNDLSTIGDTMIPPEGSVYIESNDITETSTIRLNTFPTSLNILNGVLNSDQLTLGRMFDQTTGITTATPYFQIIGNRTTGKPNYEDNYVYDSLTLAFPFDYTKNNILAGDTTSFQTYRLYQLTDYPRFDYDDPCIYNNDSLPYDPSKPLAQLTIRLDKQYAQAQSVYFKLNDELGRKLFNLVRSQDSVLNYPLDFIRYFNGLTIVPDKGNTALIPLNGSSLVLRCHYHLNTTSASYSFPAYGGYYAFTNIKHTPSNWLKDVSWRNPIPFSKAEKQAVIQGLDGYMLKLKLPFKSSVDPYRTILKAEIVLQPKIDNFENISEPSRSRIQVFTLDKYSRISGTLTDLSGNPVYGYLETNPNFKDDRKYKIDITDYYNNVISNGTGLDTEFNLLIGLTGTPLQVGTDEIKTLVGANSLFFERLIIDELPVLRIYYANY